MRAGVRQGAGLLLAPLLLLTALVGCSDSAPSQRTIGLLRAVGGTGRDKVLLDALAQDGWGKGRLHVLGLDPDEVHVSDADAAATVRRWVDRGVDVIVALSTGGAIAARRVAPASVPVLFLANDPTASGLLRDERHPEGHLTGQTYRVPADRTLAVAADAFPGLHRLGCLYASADPAAGPARAELERGAAALGMTLTCVAFHDPADAAGAVTRAARGADALVLVNSPTTSRSVAEIERGLTGLRVPVIANAPAPFAVLILQPDGAEIYRQMGRQAARLLDGAKVADVPVEDPGHFLLVVNLAAARRIGRAIPDSVVARADQVVR